MHRSWTYPVGDGKPMGLHDGGPCGAWLFVGGRTQPEAVAGLMVIAPTQREGEVSLKHREG